jgi:hypothetical protein
MSLESIVKILIGQEPSARYFRAITLFEFQVAMFDSNWFGQLVDSEGVVAAKFPKLRRARVFAAVRILESIEADLKKDKGNEDISISALAANENFRSIYDEVFARSGGTHLMRHSMSAKEFDEDLEVRRADALAVANMIDFSYRYSKHPIPAVPHGT